MAMSSTRVMGTGCSMGQAAGTAAAMAVDQGVPPAAIAEPAAMRRLQQALLYDDAYLPGVQQEFSALTTDSTYYATTGGLSALRDGINRPVGPDDHAWHCRVGDALEIQLPPGAQPRSLTVLADSALHQEIQMSYWQPTKQLPALPGSLAKDLDVEVRRGGKWVPAGEIRGNIQRQIRIPLQAPADAVRLTLRATWGDDRTRLFAVYVD
jgi:hypothetical protein